MERKSFLQANDVTFQSVRKCREKQVFHENDVFMFANLNHFHRLVTVQFSDNLSAEGTILRYTSKPERGLFIL